MTETTANEAFQGRIRNSANFMTAAAFACNRLTAGGYLEKARKLLVKKEHNIQEIEFLEDFCSKAATVVHVGNINHLKRLRDFLGRFSPAEIVSLEKLVINDEDIIYGGKLLVLLKTMDTPK